MFDINNHFCTNKDCKSYGLRKENNIVKAGKYTTTQGDVRQMLKCNICGTKFSETKNTIFFNSRYSTDIIGKIISCTVEGNGVRSTGRILNLSKDGVNKVVLKAGEHAQKVLSDLLHSLHLSECQLDELWSFVQKKALSEEDLEEESGRTWIWTAIEPESRLIIYHSVGSRTLEDCRLFFDGLLSRIENKPLFVSDELPHSESIIFENFHQEVEFPKTGKRGRPRSPEKIIDTEINYAVVHKTREGGKIINVDKRIVFGNEESINKCLEKTISNTINTSYVERSNLTFRQNDAHLQRKTLKFAKNMEYFEAKLNINILYYNFVKPHWSLSKNEDKSFTPRTPAMKAKIVKTNWTIEYVFQYPVLRA